LEDIHAGVADIALLALVTGLARRALLAADAIHALSGEKIFKVFLYINSFPYFPEYVAF